MEAEYSQHSQPVIGSGVDEATVKWLEGLSGNHLGPDPVLGELGIEGRQLFTWVFSRLPRGAQGARPTARRAPQS